MSKPTRRFYSESDSRKKDREPYLSMCGSHIVYKGTSRSTVPPPSVFGRKITHFSEKSRFRMITQLCHIDYSQIGKSIFVTVTYPDDYITKDHVQRGQDKYLFVRYCEKFLERHVCGIWRTEWKPRKTGKHVGTLAPHLHMVMFNVSFLHHTKVRAFWRDVLHEPGKLVTDVRACNGGQGALWYVSKYAAKVELPYSLDYSLHLNNPDGRHWGYLRKDEVPVHKEEFMRNLNQRQVEYLLSVAQDRLKNRILRSEYSFTLLGLDERHLANLVQLGLPLGSEDDKLDITT